MKKLYLLEDLDCAHCAGKIEEAIGKLEGVNQCTITFLTGKMSIDMEEEKEKEIIDSVKKIIKKIEPDVTFKEK